ncbi:MAG: electron transport complex subunit RsxE, partial [Alistipes sp.]|nr:electron transport complex subunit RsxE [Alistipes sp.]
AFIVIIASFVTIIQMLMQAFVPALYASLGVFIPLIVVNCIILGRAEAFASKNNPFDSMLDGIGIGLGFTLSLTVVGAVREMLGSGAVFGYSFGIGDYMPLIFVLAPGAFLVLGYLMVLFNKLAKK